MMKRLSWVGGILTLLSAMQAHGHDSSVSTQDSTQETTIEAGESAVAAPKRSLLPWNEFDGSFSTLRIGLGLLYEVDAFLQDTQSEQQFDLEPEAGFRDFRVMFKGRFKSERPISWTSGIMYDGPTKSWLFRETGIMIGFPELWGNLFVGRTKGGFSLNKVMVGYAGWTMERATFSDAFIPILADGVKWLGYLPNRGLLWNIGIYSDLLSEGQSFSSYDWQFITRLAWLPIISKSEGTLLHIGINGRYGQANEGNLRIRSRPEAFLSPYFVDTGLFPAHHTRQGGLEMYYRNGRVLFGTEYYVQSVSASGSGNPVFQGGDFVVTWLITGETRSYNTSGGYFLGISPDSTLFSGGPGAWEAVFRVSYIDLDGGTLRGGKFYRITPMVNWHMSDNLRLEFTYGYGVLNRFDLEGATQFFQVRIQLQI